MQTANNHRNTGQIPNFFGRKDKQCSLFQGVLNHNSSLTVKYKNALNTILIIYLPKTSL